MFLSPLSYFCKSACNESDITYLISCQSNRRCFSQLLPSRLGPLPSTTISGRKLYWQWESSLLGQRFLKTGWETRETEDPISTSIVRLQPSASTVTLYTGVLSKACTWNIGTSPCCVSSQTRRTGRLQVSALMSPLLPLPPLLQAFFKWLLITLVTHHNLLTLHLVA